jgi:hypothetical protein
MAITVTATNTSTSPNNGILLRVLVLNFAALAGSPAVAHLGITSSTVLETSITTTTAGSVVVGALESFDVDVAFVAESGTTLLDNVQDATNVNQYGTLEATAVTGTPGSTSFGSTGAVAHGSISLMEVLASGGSIATDASSPAPVTNKTGTTATTASFTPPAGSLVVALVCNGGPASSSNSGTASISDTSGMTWTMQVQNSANGNEGYSGIFTAIVPGAAPATPMIPPPQAPGRSSPAAWALLAPPFKTTVPPSIHLVNNAAGGTNATTVTTGNSGGASGNAFDNVLIGTGAALTASNTVPGPESLALAYEVSTGSTTSDCYAAWTASISALGQQPQLWFRVYLYFTAFPSGSFRLVEFISASTEAASLQIDTSGLIHGLNSASSSLYTFTNPFPLNRWFRVEGNVQGDPTYGVVTIWLFDSPESITPSETHTVVGTNVAGPLSTARFGVGFLGVPNIGPFWMSNLGVSSSGPLGPVGTQPPVIPVANRQRSTTLPTWIRAQRPPQKVPAPVISTVLQSVPREKTRQLKAFTTRRQLGMVPTTAAVVVPPVLASRRSNIRPVGAVTRRQPQLVIPELVVPQQTTKSRARWFGVFRLHSQQQVPAPVISTVLQHTPRSRIRLLGAFRSRSIQKVPAPITQQLASRSRLRLIGTRKPLQGGMPPAVVTTPVATLPPVQVQGRIKWLSTFRSRPIQKVPAPVISTVLQHTPRSRIRLLGVFTRHQTQKAPPTVLPPVQVQGRIKPFSSFRLHSQQKVPAPVISTVLQHTPRSRIRFTGTRKPLQRQTSPATLIVPLQVRGRIKWLGAFRLKITQQVPAPVISTVLQSTPRSRIRFTGIFKGHSNQLPPPPVFGVLAIFTPSQIRSKIKSFGTFRLHSQQQVPAPVISTVLQSAPRSRVRLLGARKSLQTGVVPARPVIGSIRSRVRLLGTSRSRPIQLPQPIATSAVLVPTQVRSKTKWLSNFRVRGATQQTPAPVISTVLQSTPRSRMRLFGTFRLKSLQQPVAPVAVIVPPTPYGAPKARPRLLSTFKSRLAQLPLSSATPPSIQKYRPRHAATRRTKLQGLAVTIPVVQQPRSKSAIGLLRRSRTQIAPPTVQAVVQPSFVPTKRSTHYRRPSRPASGIPITPPPAKMPPTRVRGDRFRNFFLRIFKRTTDLIPGLNAPAAGGTVIAADFLTQTVLARDFKPTFVIAYDSDPTVAAKDFTTVSVTAAIPTTPTVIARNFLTATVTAYDTLVKSTVTAKDFSTATVAAQDFLVEKGAVAAKDFLAATVIAYDYSPTTLARDRYL